jgi:hypothetical protein
METIKIIGMLLIFAFYIVPQVLAECGPTWENPRGTSVGEFCSR